MTGDSLSGATVDGYGMIMPNGDSGRDGVPQPLSMRVSPGQRSRALRIADALLKAMEARGHSIDPGKAGDARRSVSSTRPSIMVDGQSIPILFEEKADRNEHVPTAAEIAEKKRYSWHSIPRWDYRPSGKLSLKIDVGVYWTEGIRKRWSDGRGRLLEECLNEVIIAMVEVATALRKHKEEAAREAALRREQERLRQERERLRRMEKARQKILEECSRLWVQAHDLRRFMDAVEQRVRDGREDPSDRITEWVHWARGHADRLDPLARGIGALIDEQEAAAKEQAEPKPAWMQGAG